MAVLQKRAAGFVLLERTGNEAASPRVSKLLAIVVAPWARRRGLEDRLMQTIMRRADNLTVDRLVLHTAVDNLPGQALLRKHGFAPCGIKTRFYPEGQDALVMERRKE